MTDKMEGKPFFETVTFFVKPNSQGQIETKTFLEAAKCIVQFVELLGTTFLPVKKDIEGNINKLTTIYDSNPTKYEYLDTIIITEKAELKECEFHIGTDALTWLNRALVYNQLFLTAFYEDYCKADGDHNIAQLSDDLSSHFKNAYNLSLKKHHNWLVQNIFSLCVMAAPSRANFVKYLGYNYDQSVEMRDAIRRDFGNYLDHLKSNTEAIGLALFKEGYQP